MESLQKRFNFLKLESPYLIAEIGINHNGDVSIAKKLIDASVACGWDCVKFQKRTPDICVPEHQKSLMRKTPWGEMTYLEYKKKIEFGFSQYLLIDNYCYDSLSKKIDWTVSVWDEPSVDFIESNFDVPFLKIPSAKLTDHNLIKRAIKVAPLLVSTGMSTHEEIDRTVNILYDVSGPENFALMHCNSSYPAKNSELNLKCIPNFIKRYGCSVGYSDHNYGLVSSTTAVALGAKIIERHVTLDRTMWGTDQSSSVELPGMYKLKKHIDDVLEMLGDGRKVLYESEKPARRKLRGTD